MATLAAAPAAGARVAGEAPEVAGLWIEPATAPTGGARPGLLAPLFLPQGWAAGDAAVVLAVPGHRPEAWRDPLVGRLLGDGAAVLDLAAHGAPRDDAAGDSEAGEALLPDLFGALLALRRDAGSGVVVVVGQGAAGAAAVLAADDALAAAHLGVDGPRFAAAASFQAGRRPAFAAGAKPPPAERWDSRAPLFCRLLAPAAGAAEAAACADALLLPPPAPPAAEGHGTGRSAALR